MKEHQNELVNFGEILTLFKKKQNLFLKHYLAIDTSVEKKPRNIYRFLNLQKCIKFTFKLKANIFLLKCMMERIPYFRHLFDMVVRAWLEDYSEPKHDSRKKDQDRKITK